MLVTALLLTLAFLLLTVAWWQVRRVYRTFERLGLNGPPPSFLLGNLLELYKNKDGKSTEEVYADWVSKYGPVFGFFEGLHPMLFVSHPDALQQILQTDFGNFTNRPLRDEMFHGHRGDVFSTRGQRWKRVRSVLSPVFSPSSMREVAPTVEDKVQLLVDKLREKSEAGTGFDIYVSFQMLTLDIIAQMIFGADINCIHDDSHPFIHHCRETFRRIAIRPFYTEVTLRGVPTHALRTCLYRLICIIDKWRHGAEDSLNHFYYLAGCVQKSAEERQGNPVSASEPDLLDMMLKHASDGGIPEDAMHFKGNFRKQMTFQEILSNCWVFLVAGFETSSTALAYLAHALCHHPKVQEKLATEIQNHQNAEKQGGNDGRITYASVLKMEYLHQVVCETMRVLPPAPSVMRRQAVEDFVLNVSGNNVQVPGGMTVQIGALSTHMDPNFWPNPSEFDPSRFAAETRKSHHPFQWLPFGLGPRGCIGMRLAMMEIKLALANLIAKYRIERCEKTMTELEFLEGVTRTPKHGVFVKLTPRVDVGDGSAPDQL